MSLLPNTETLDLAEKGEIAIRVTLVNARNADPDLGAPADEIFMTFSSDAQLATDDYVVVSCLGGAEDGMNSGNERLSFSISVASAPWQLTNEEGTLEAATAPFDRHRERVGAVFNVLRQREIHEILTDAIEDFTVFDSVTFRRSKQAVRTSSDGGHKVVSRFLSEIILEMACAPSDIS